MQKLIFYGSLMDIDLFYQITGIRPIRVRYGYVFGDLYEVTDNTEPWGIYKYPLFMPSQGINVVICKEVTVHLRRTQKANFWERLKAFEGKLYETASVRFHPFKGRSIYCITFVGNRTEMFGKNNIVKLEPLSTIYAWNHKKCISA